MLHLLLIFYNSDITENIMFYVHISFPGNIKKVVCITYIFLQIIVNLKMPKLHIQLYTAKYTFCAANLYLHLTVKVTMEILYFLRCFSNVLSVRCGISVRFILSGFIWSTANATASSCFSCSEDREIIMHQLVHF